MHIILILPHRDKTESSELISRRDTSLEVQRPLRNEQGDNFEENKTISTLVFLFLQAKKRTAGVDLQSPTGASACNSLFSAFNLAFNNICDKAIAASWMHLPPFFAWICSRSRNDLRHFYWRFLFICKRCSWSVDGRTCFFFFFFFFFYWRSHNESGPNTLTPIWKFFRLSAMCKLFRWPLSPQPKIKKCETTFCRSALLLSFCVSVTINKKVNSTEQGAFFSKVITIAHAHKKVSFFIFCQELSNKKIKALRRKMTKIASGGSCLKSYNNLLVGFHRLHWRAYAHAEAIAVHVKDFEIFRCPHFEKKKSDTEIKSWARWNSNRVPLDP